MKFPVRCVATNHYNNVFDKHPMFFSSKQFKMLWIIAGGSPFDVKVSIQASHWGELTLRSSRSFIQPAMFDLEIKTVVGGLGW